MAVRKIRLRELDDIVLVVVGAAADLEEGEKIAAELECPLYTELELAYIWSTMNRDAGTEYLKRDFMAIYEIKKAFGGFVSVPRQKREALREGTNDDR